MNLFNSVHVALMKISMTTQNLTFQRDHHLRRKFFTEETFQHKARINLFWLAWLLDHHTDPGKTVLDPMGGAGSILLAATKQRPVLTGDIEPHWTRLQGQNAHRIQTQMMFSAPAHVARWDAAKLPIATGTVPAIVTSPPYFDMFSDWNRKTGIPMDGAVGETGLCYGFHDQQLGNIHIYENYLRAMRHVYRECWRVLGPEGIFVLIVGDRVKKFRIVPITDDTSALCQANGFDLLNTHRRQTKPSQYRIIHSITNGNDYPIIDVETALIFQKRNSPARQTKQRFALLEAPNPNSSPGQLLFEKQLAYAHITADQVLVLTKDGLISGHIPNSVSSLEENRIDERPNTVWAGDHERKARVRKDWSFSIARQLVTKHGLAAGDEIELHVTLRYARYLEQRLNSFSARATVPTARHNLGQKLTWYTKALSMLLEQAQTQFGCAAGSQPNNV